MRGVETIAERGDWKSAGDIGPCDIDRCLEVATKYAWVLHGKATDLWFFCGKHFAEYLRICDAVREKKRNESQETN